MRVGVRLGPLWLSERLPPLRWPPSGRTLALLAVLLVLAWVLR